MQKQFYLLLIVVACMLGTAVSPLSAQEKRAGVNVSLRMNNATARQVFEELEKQTPYTFLYSVGLFVPNELISINVQRKDLFAVLDEILVPRRLTYKVDDKVIVITATTPSQRKEVTITGKVRDTSGEPLISATIIQKGTTHGTLSATDGSYSITVPQSDHIVLTYSFVGMERKEVRYNGKNVINVTLQDDLALSQDVIITGYERIKKNEMIGSTSVVNMDSVVADRTRSIASMLQGKVPGMLVTESSGMAGTKPKVRVRGTSTLLGKQEPIWVVDGIIQEDPLPFKTSELDNFGGISQDNMDLVATFVGNSISWLNPNDIKDITILKDATATVLYGTKAANGVIVINTKRGAKGRMSVNYSGTVSFGERMSYDKLNLMNSKQRIAISRQNYEDGYLSNYDLEQVGFEGALRRYLLGQSTYDQYTQEVKRLETTNTDWFDILYRNPISTSHSASISGGSDKITYYASLRGQLSNGTARGNDKTTVSSSVRITANLNKDLTVGFSVSGSQDSGKGFYQVDPYTYAMTTSRAIPAYNEDGSDFFYVQRDSEQHKYNIQNELRNTSNSNVSRNIRTNLNVQWKILPTLRYESTFGLNYSNTSGETYATEFSNYISQIRGYEFGEYDADTPEYKQSRLPWGGILSKDEVRNTNYTWRNQLNYNTLLGEKHNIGVTMGQEIRSNKYDGYGSTVYGYLRDRGRSIVLPPATIASQSVNTPSVRNSIYDSFRNTVTDTEARYVSFYGSLFYGYDERYMVNASLRNDASNRFGQDARHRFLPVWSIGGRWNVTNEKWMQNQTVFSHLNINATYGWQGNVVENTSPYLITRYPTPSIDDLTGGYMQEIKTMPSKDLKWEKTKTINLSFDAGFFKNRLTASFEYYHKKTVDLISFIQLPYELGGGSMPVNNGSMLNRGWEVQVTATPVRTKDWIWNITMNTSKNYNEIKSNVNQANTWQNSASGSLPVEGYPIGSFWVFEYLGLNQTNGLPMFNIPGIDQVPDAKTNATSYMMYAGTTEPKFQGGISTVLRYKTFSFSASFNLQLGAKKLMYPLYTTYTDLPSAYNNLPTDLVNSWRQPGDRTDIPVMPHLGMDEITLPNGVINQYHKLYDNSSIRVANASFLRCQYMSLAYTVPSKHLEQLKIQNLSVSLNVTNPFLIADSKWKGFDPEVASKQQPILRNYSLSINVGF